MLSRICECSCAAGAITRYIIIIIIIMLVLLLNQWCTPPLRLQISDCSTFLIMCDAPSTAIFCRESIQFSLGIVFTFF
jgi:hypothetical protein